MIKLNQTAKTQTKNKKMSLMDYKRLVSLSDTTESQDRRGSSLLDIEFIEFVLWDFKSKIENNYFIDFELDTKTIKANLNNIIEVIEKWRIELK